MEQTKLQHFSICCWKFRPIRSPEAPAPSLNFYPHFCFALLRSRTTLHGFSSRPRHVHSLGERTILDFEQHLTHSSILLCSTWAEAGEGKLWLFWDYLEFEVADPASWQFLQLGSKTFQGREALLNFPCCTYTVSQLLGTNAAGYRLFLHCCGVSFHFRCHSDGRAHNYSVHHWQRHFWLFKGRTFLLILLGL